MAQEQDWFAAQQPAADDWFSAQQSQPGPMTQEFGYPIQYEEPNYRPPSLGEMAKTGVGVLAGGAAVKGGIAAGRLLTKLPWGGFIRAGAAAATGGPRMRAAKQAYGAWQKAKASQAAPAVPEAVKAVTAAKPKLSAAEVTAKMREQYGAEKAGRMLFGPTQKGAAGSAVESATARTEAVRRMAPGPSTLPKGAQARIAKELEKLSPEDAFKYAASAPNVRAQEFFGDQLRQSLLEMMKKR